MDSGFKYYVLRFVSRITAIIYICIPSFGFRVLSYVVKTDAKIYLVSLLVLLYSAYSEYLHVSMGCLYYDGFQFLELLFKVGSLYICSVSYPTTYFSLSYYFPTIVGLLPSIRYSGNLRFLYLFRELMPQAWL